MLIAFIGRWLKKVISPFFDLLGYCPKCFNLIKFVVSLSALFFVDSEGLTEGFSKKKLDLEIMDRAMTKGHMSF